MSKNALKKLQKAEEAAKKKAAKDAEKQAKKGSEVASSKPKLDEAEDLDPTQYYENRMRAIRLIEVQSSMYIIQFSCEIESHLFQSLLGRKSYRISAQVSHIIKNF